MNAARALAIVALFMLLSGCAQVGYYAQSVGGQMEIWRLQRPIADWLADPATPEPVRARLRRVNDIREFAVNELALPRNGSYGKYADLGRPYVVWNVFAAGEFSLQPHQS